MVEVILLSFLILMFGCKNGGGASGEHLSPKLMQKVMMDVNLAETYSTHVQDGVHRGSMKNTDSLSAYYKTIFSHYKITEEEFYSSMEWYKSHPEELDSIYAKMLTLVTAMQPKLTPIKPIPKSDSAAIKKVDSVLNRAANISALSKTDTVKGRPEGIKKPTVDTVKHKEKKHVAKKPVADSTKKK